MRFSISMYPDNIDDSDNFASEALGLSFEYFPFSIGIETYLAIIIIRIPRRVQTSPQAGSRRQGEEGRKKQSPATGVWKREKAVCLSNSAHISLVT